MGDLDGTNIHQLTNDDFYMVSRASISPDGKTLLFVSSESHGDVIAICSLEQPPMPRLVLKPRVQNRLGEAVISDAMFLPDGKNILFSAATDGAGGSYDYDIYRMELHAQTVEKLTTANGYSYGLQLSPDGRTGLFVKNIPHWYGDEAKVFLLDLVTRKLTPLNITGLE